MGVPIFWAFHWCFLNDTFEIPKSAYQEWNPLILHFPLRHFQMSCKETVELLQHVRLSRWWIQTYDELRLSQKTDITVEVINNNLKYLGSPPTQSRHQVVYGKSQSPFPNGSWYPGAAGTLHFGVPCRHGPGKAVFPDFRSEVVFVRAGHNNLLLFRLGCLQEMFSLERERERWSVWH